MIHHDKTVVITGGAKGIGMATALAFAQSGAEVVIADIDIAAGDALVERIHAEGHSALAVETDVASQASVAALFHHVASRFGQVDVLVNNAGIGGFGTLADTDLDAWQRVLSVNLTGAYLCVRHALPLMSSGTAIINIASTRALMSEPNTEAYSASKGGLLALTHALSVSLAKRRIRVNAVCPGWIDVSAWRPGGCQEELRPRDHDQHPAGRVGRPEDIAQVVLYLADDERSGFMTGANLVVDGGMTRKMIYEP